MIDRLVKAYEDDPRLFKVVLAFTFGFGLIVGFMLA